MKYGEIGEEDTGEMVNPFDEFTNQYQHESTPLEEMQNPETSDFSSDLFRQEKGKLRGIPEIKENTRDGMIDQYTRNLKQWEEILRKAYKSGHYFNMRSAIFTVFKLKDMLRIMEENPNLPPSALKKEFHRSRIGGKVQQIIDSKPSRYVTPGHSPLVGLVEKYLGINEKNKSTPEVIRRKKATLDEELLKRYPEATREHKCPAVVEGWSSIEDCLPSCSHKMSMNEDDYWRDDAYGRELDAEFERPRSKEEILSTLPSGKHTKHLRDSIMDDKEYEDYSEEELYRRQHETLKHKDKDRERY